MKKNLLRIGLLSLLVSACTYAPYYSKDVREWEKVETPDSSSLTYTIYLLGDAGAPDLQKQEPTFKLMQSFIERDSNSAAVFLGDNIYHNGLPGKSVNGRDDAERKINEQLDMLKNYKGEVYFISGNHDWDYMGPEGLERVKSQEEYIETYLNRGNTFVPDGGCPGPYSTRLHNNVVLIALDSQWWLHKYNKPYGRCGNCNAEDEDDFLLQFEDFVRNNQNRHILVVAHHPLVSNGNHGGYYNILDHIFPLRLLQHPWYIPLPVIGSLYPLHRKFGGVDQDIPHYRYQEFKRKITNIIANYDNVVYAAGHDHNLQYHRLDSLNHIISGAGSKMNPVKGGEDATYTHKHKGFAKVMYYANGEAWVEFWIPEGDGDKGKCSFRTKLYKRKIGSPESYCSLSAISYKDSSVVVQPTGKYKASRFKEFFFGIHYRDEWITPVKVPLLDLKTEKGGLIPYGIGGGKQSISLKLKNIDDKEYVLRSINKDPTKAIPENLRYTFLHDIVNDQISAQHPYGALAVPRLADAVGVYHTNPKLVLIPNDSCLGPYREQFKNMLVMFEEDADENHDDVASLGYSKNLVGTDRMRDEIESDNDNRLDERNFLRARILDMLIGDWDRHERQYRWAAVEGKDGKRFYVVPEDRDQAFFKFDGILPYFSSRTWAVRNLKNFENDFEDLKGLNLSARLVDRRYLSSLSREDWKQIADSMRAELTDEVITNSVCRIPREVYSHHGPEIVSKLKSRREQLTDAADKYYEILAKYVDVYGSDKYEYFNVERLDKERTRVTVYKINKEGEIKDKIYERMFFSSETKEIRLYGLGGEDAFNVTGNVKNSIKVRMLGGEDKDSYIEKSKVGGIGKKSILYDTKDDNKIDVSKETNKELSKNTSIHYTSQDNFSYNYLGPQIGFAYNPDDGFFLGGGFLYKKYKFRHNPYGSMHKLLGSIATNTGSVRIDYQGEIKGIVSKLDLGIDAHMFTPAFVMNFFGYGNESPGKDTIIEYYRVRLQQINVNPSLNKTFTRYLIAGVGPRYQNFKVEKNPNSLLGQTTPENSEIYHSRHYLGLRGFFRLGTRDNDRNPTRGILLTGEANFNQRLDKSGFYTQYLSDFAFYITPNIPFQLTFAGRIGGAANFGEYEFYQANTLGSYAGIGLSGGNLRGFRKTRFVADRILYQNIEVRSQLFKFNTYIFPGKFGILAFFDNGRGWAENEHSKKWHMGYGGGIWIDLFEKFIFNAMYGLSDEDQVLNLRLGFFF